MTELEDLIDMVAVRNGWILHSRDPGNTVEYRRLGSGYIRLKLEGDRVVLVTTRKWSRSLPDLDPILSFLGADV